jgi:hypothetical protein
MAPNTTPFTGCRQDGLFLTLGFHDIPADDDAKSVDAAGSPPEPVKLVRFVGEVFVHRTGGAPRAEHDSHYDVDITKSMHYDLQRQLDVAASKLYLRSPANALACAANFQLWKDVGQWRVVYQPHQEQADSANPTSHCPLLYVSLVHPIKSPARGIGRERELFVEFTDAHIREFQDALPGPDRIATIRTLAGQASLTEEELSSIVDLDVATANAPPRSAKIVRPRIEGAPRPQTTSEYIDKEARQCRAILLTMVNNLPFSLRAEGVMILSTTPDVFIRHAKAVFRVSTTRTGHLLPPDGGRLETHLAGFVHPKFLDPVGVRWALAQLGRLAGSDDYGACHYEFHCCPPDQGPGPPRLQLERVEKSGWIGATILLNATRDPCCFYLFNPATHPRWAPSLPDEVANTHTYWLCVYFRAGTLSELPDKRTHLDTHGFHPGLPDPTAA